MAALRKYSLKQIMKKISLKNIPAAPTDWQDRLNKKIRAGLVNCDGVESLARMIQEDSVSIDEISEVFVEAK